MDPTKGQQVVFNLRSECRHFIFHVTVVMGAFLFRDYYMGYRVFTRGLLVAAKETTGLDFLDGVVVRDLQKFIYYF